MFIVFVRLWQELCYIYGICRIYYFLKLVGCILFNQQLRKPSKKLFFSPSLPLKFKPQPL